MGKDRLSALIFDKKRQYHNRDIAFFLLTSEPSYQKNMGGSSKILIFVHSRDIITVSQKILEVKNENS